MAAEKAQAAYKHFNLRVVEGRLAIALLGKSLGLEEWQSFWTLHALDEALRGRGADGKSDWLDQCF